MSDQNAPPPLPAAAVPSGDKGPGALGIGGWIFAVIALLVLLAGLAATAIHLTQRDSSGYYTSSLLQIESAGYAVYASGLEIDTAAGADVAQDVLGDVRVRAQAAEGAVFVGVARQADLDRYLGDSPRSKVKEVNGGDVTYRPRGGGTSRPAPPTEQTFWRAKATGPGVQTMNWEAEEGNFAIVVMNADGSRPVRAAVTAGARAPIVLYIGIGLLVIALILGAVGFAMIRSDSRSRSRASG